jgi:hypothetical protein
MFRELVRSNKYTVKPQFFFSSGGGPEKERWIRENNRCGAYIKWDLFRNNRNWMMDPGR